MINKTAQQIEAILDPQGAIAPDAQLAEAVERLQRMQVGFRAATETAVSREVEEVDVALEEAVLHLGHAAVALAEARAKKDALLQRWGVDGTAAAPRPTRPQSGEAAVYRLPGAAAVPAEARPAKAVVPVEAAPQQIPAENRGWESPVLRMGAVELAARLRNINFHPYGDIHTTGIKELRDVYMAPDKLAKSGVVAHEALNRLRREMREQYPDLPEIPFRGGDPELAAYLYETAEEVPADLVLGRHVEALMGHAIPRGTRVTLAQYLELLKERTGIHEPLPQADADAYHAALERARDAKGGIMPGMQELLALNEGYAFLEKFNAARAAGRRPRAAGDNRFGHGFRF